MVGSYTVLFNTSYNEFSWLLNLIGCNVKGRHEAHKLIAHG